MNFMFDLSQYETVDQRLEKFWAKYPDGAIITEMVAYKDDRFIFKASVYKTYADILPFATGFAEEIVSGRGVNATSACENSESSAIGRALHTGGISKHSDGKPRPSREEMTKVTKAEPKPFAEKLADKITVEVADDPWTVKAVEPAPSAADAVALVQEVLGAVKIDKDIPHCKHGERRWKDGNKNGRAWGAMQCNGQPQRNETWADFDKCEPIWYVISPDGTWKPQVPR
jgi:hypothetical protein